MCEEKEKEEAVGHRDSKSSSSRSKCTHSCARGGTGAIGPSRSVAQPLECAISE